MKKLILKVSVAITMFTSVGSIAQGKNQIQAAKDSVQQKITVISDDSLMKLNIIKFCDALGIPSEYNVRYKNIILPLCDAGVIVIDPKTNPYTNGSTLNLDLGNGRTDLCYMYIGTAQQNEILKRNILANRNLLVKGKVTNQTAKRWKVVK